MPPLVDDDGSVALEVILIVLGACLTGGEVSFRREVDQLHIITSGVPEVILVADRIPRRMVHRISRKTGIKIELFYNPEMCTPGNPGLKQ